MTFDGLRVLVVGAGGLGCPAALALAGAGVGTLALADDDEVDAHNLHRQLLYRRADVGAPKVDAAKSELERRFPGLRVVAHATRFLPSTAEALLAEVDVVVEGADNFATKFLVADACARYQRPVVHGAALRWNGTVLAVSASRRPCYRCVFEDIPPGPAPSCATAGVMGPVCGVVGALMAEAALRLARVPSEEAGVLRSFDGKALETRTARMRARRSCRLCGDEAVPPRLVGSDYEEAR